MRLANSPPPAEIRDLDRWIFVIRLRLLSESLFIKSSSRSAPSERLRMTGPMTHFGCSLNTILGPAQLSEAASRQLQFRNEVHQHPVHRCIAASATSSTRRIHDGELNAIYRSTSSWATNVYLVLQLIMKVCAIYSKYTCQPQPYPWQGDPLQVPTGTHQ
jgi:hypothetical protein